MKIRQAKVAARRKAWMLKKQADVPLEDNSDADVDADDLLYNEKDHIDDELSTDDELIRHYKDSSDEEEVLPITDDEKGDSDDEKEDFDEEEEDSDEEKGLPSRDVWGKKKYTYYNADFVDEDRGKTYREEDAEKARAEAEEALAIQKSVSSYADVNITELFQLETAEDLPKEESDEDAKLDSLDHVQKMKLLKKKSPELLLYIDECLEKMEELKDKFLPLISFVQKVELPSEACAHYIKIKYQALLHYCMNISFYMSLRSKGPVHISHPIIRRINYFKDILDRLNNVNKTFKKEIDILVKKLKSNEEISITRTQPSTETNKPITEENVQNISILENLETVSKDGSKRKRDKESMSKQFETQDEKEILSLYQQFKDLKKQKISDVPLDMEEESIDEEMEEDFHAQEETDGKRNITYHIAKNKGLTVKQKKQSKTPRVKNRMKFKKAQIKRKGQVRGVIRELKRYDGEPTGISSHVVRSVKYK